MEWTDDHDILLLREMIATEFFQCKKGSPDRGKIWESIQERLNKLDNPKFMIKEKRGELELQRKEQEVRARQQELQIELLRKQTEQQVQISQALMTMMQNMVKK
ncbi:unnamed protein product [Porites lobata]|uniref:Uncharacterized protein n=1 Tax=Porites lobata TaxID=104759 RepID=A0ABN8Q085_9CNID|nr:unnamed protein product [Porites lobata]